MATISKTSIIELEALAGINRSTVSMYVQQAGDAFVQEHFSEIGFDATRAGDFSMKVTIEYTDSEKNKKAPKKAPETPAGDAPAADEVSTRKSGRPPLG